MELLPSVRNPADAGLHVQTSTFVFFYSAVLGQGKWRFGLRTLEVFIAALGSLQERNVTPYTRLFSL